MSRTMQARSGPAVTRSSDQDGELHRHFSNMNIDHSDPFATDICPVCKSSRYLNKSMRFLVNPECYHKMCESCVDRIFSHGPNKCPIAGCNRTLRKHRFREQTFEDIQVEREVDIRKRVAAIFNRREDEFDSLMDYNNYLNDVEDITYNLINKVHVEETERKLQAYASQNSESISQNATLASREAQDFTALQAAEREQARLRREAARREEEEERKEKREGRQNILDRLASGVDAKELEKEQQIALRKKTEKKEQAERLAQMTNGAAGNGGFTIKGLRTKKEPEPEKPFDPFGGFSIKPQYYAVQERYEWPWLNGLRDDVIIDAGGFKIQEFHTRALCEAFSGLGVFVGKEQRDSTVGKEVFGEPGVGTVAAAEVAGGDVKMEDPF
ncbi:CDK-activating kinase assembly factor [Myriangium duriaei CBS 260.36]|uniref:RNA polymerase II transcription factor B subunit 3 n=1 Tax=Myriangium duriaei CBS 260.36 TaxID=1168546 RepID=A0A9P4MHN1_9PEZI|nr:CDK-activating kinase assembly factor [Myriangium duriaei CBS 260.36]